MKDLLDALQIQDGQKPRAASAKPWLLLAGVLVCGIAGWAWRSHARPAVKVDAIPVAPLPAARPRIALTAGGYVKDPTIVYVVPRISGRIAALMVREGDQVRAGDLLAKLDTGDLQKEVDEARANLRQAEAHLNQLRSGSRAEDVAERRARVEGLLHARERSLRELQRHRPLFEAGAVSAQVLDQVNTEFLVAEKNLDAARQALAALEAGPRVEEIHMAEAAQAASLARYEAALNRIGYAEVRAPLSGRVLKKYRETGDRVSPEVPFVQAYDTVAVGSPIVAIASLEDQEVSADINETDLGKVALHQPVEITPNAFPNEKFSGTVTRVAPRADRNKNTIEVRVTLARGARKLPYDMSVKLRFADGNRTTGESR